MEILITCPVNPTEDITRVRIALENLLGGPVSTATESDDISEISTSYNNRDGVSSLRQAIHETRIIDAARKRLESNWNGTSTKIYFDKQAAYAKKVRIIDDNQDFPPLGCIEVVYVFDSEQEFKEFVGWFTPRTKDGRIINH